MPLRRAALAAFLASSGASVRADGPGVAGRNSGPHPAIARSSRKEPRIYLAIGSTVDKTRLGGPELSARLRAAIRTEIDASTVFTPQPTGDGFALDASITHLDHRVNGKWDEISCEVSFIVERLPQKSILGMTSVTAMVQSLHAAYQPEMESDLRTQAVEAAVHGAQPNLASIMARPTSRRR